MLARGVRLCGTCFVILRSVADGSGANGPTAEKGAEQYWKQSTWADSLCRLIGVGCGVLVKRCCRHGKAEQHFRLLSRTSLRSHQTQSFGGFHCFASRCARKFETETKSTKGKALSTIPVTHPLLHERVTGVREQLTYKRTMLLNKSTFCAAVPCARPCAAAQTRSARASTQQPLLGASPRRFVSASAVAEPQPVEKVTGDVVEKCIRSLQFLAVDATNSAASGHPGAPMALAPAAYVLFNEYMKFNPKNPGLFNRDRFVLSNGHASMLQYGILHLCGSDTFTVRPLLLRLFSDVRLPHVACSSMMASDAFVARAVAVKCGQTCAPSKLLATCPRVWAWDLSARVSSRSETPMQTGALSCISWRSCKLLLSGAVKAHISCVSCDFLLSSWILVPGQHNLCVADYIPVAHVHMH